MIDFLWSLGPANFKEQGRRAARGKNVAQWENERQEGPITQYTQLQDRVVQTYTMLKKGACQKSGQKSTACTEKKMFRCPKFFGDANQNFGNSSEKFRGCNSGYQIVLN